MEPDRQGATSHPPFGDRQLRTIHHQLRRHGAPFEEGPPLQRDGDGIGRKERPIHRGVVEADLPEFHLERGHDPQVRILDGHAITGSCLKLSQQGRRHRRLIQHPGQGNEAG